MEKTFNKTNLVKQISKQEGVNRIIALKIINDIFHTIASELQNGANVRILNFGEWLVKNRKKRNGRNPQTNQTIVIPAHKSVTFKAGKKLKSLVK